jgi:MFS family permease
LLLGAANPALDATRIDIVPSRLLGRAEAVRGAARDSADASAPIVFGVLAGHLGLRQTFLLMTGSLVLALGLCVVSLRTFPRDIAAVSDVRLPDPVIG